MVAALVVGLLVTSLALAAFGGARSLLGRPVNNALLVGAITVEVVLVVQVLVATALLVAGRRPTSLPTFLAYLVGVLVALPAAVAWALAERTRWSSAVVAAGALVVAVMTVRLDALWGTGA